MSRSSLAVVLGSVLAASLAVSALAEKPQPANPFERFGNPQAVRALVDKGYRSILAEKISPDDLEEALAEIAREFESIAQEAGSRRAEALKERRRVGELTRGLVVLQLRAGAGGGNPNQIFMHGKKSAYVDSVAAAPLDLQGDIDIGERSRAYFEGGYIPKGKAFVIKRAEYWGTAKGDSNGHGEFKLVLGGKAIAAAADKDKVERDTWKGTVVVQAGQEDQVYLEIANSSRGTVRLKGYLVDAKLAEVAQTPPLTAEQTKAVERWLTELNADTAAERDRAQDQILALGPAVVACLKSKKELPARTKARISDILEHFGE